LDVSIIIPTYRRHQMLEACLERLVVSLGHAKASGLQCEVIISDDEQSSQLRDLLAAKFSDTVNWFAGPARGPAANRNHGASKAKGDWLIFLDDDCLPDSELIISYASQFGEADILEGRIEADRERQRYDEESPVNLYGGYLWACNIAVQRAVFDSLSGFDEDYIHASMEDVDFRERAIRQELKIQFVAAAKVIHPWRRMQGTRMNRKRMDSHLIYWEKHPEQKPKSIAVFFLRPLLISFFKDTLANLWRYRMRGLGYQLINNLSTIKWLLVHTFRK